MTTTMSAPLHAADRRAPTSPGEQLLARLEDPDTAAALHSLLDNAELLALLASMADGVVRRSETLTANLADSINEVRGASSGSIGQARSTLSELTALLPALTAALPALSALLASDLVKPRTVAALDAVSGALVEGLAERAPHRTGVRGLLGELRDPATSRGLGQLLAVARALGRRAGG